MITQMNAVCITLILIEHRGQSGTVWQCKIASGLASISRRISIRFHLHLASRMRSRVDS
jgi:hypothetical protein